MPDEGNKIMRAPFFFLRILWTGIFLFVDGFYLHLYDIVKGPSTVRTAHRGIPDVWVQEAEAGFVEEDENLEEGEICHLSLKSFASSVSSQEEDCQNRVREPRFLCAGALVQRPASPVCDAWTADALLEEGGPNLQYQGAVQVLDALLLNHLQRAHRCDGEHFDPIPALQNFVVQCGGDSEDALDSRYSCASYMAATSRGFRPLTEMVRTNSIYTPSTYDLDLQGLVLDVHSQGKYVYHQHTKEACEEQAEVPNYTVSQIYELLPDDDTIRRCTYKRYSSNQ